MFEARNRIRFITEPISNVHDHGQSRTIWNMTNSDQAADSDLDLGNQFLADEQLKPLSMCVFFNLSSVFLFVLSHTIKSITSRLWSLPENLFYDEWQRRTPLFANICLLLSFYSFFFLPISLSCPWWGENQSQELVSSRWVIEAAPLAVPTLFIFLFPTLFYFLFPTLFIFL